MRRSFLRTSAAAVAGILVSTASAAWFGGIVLAAIAIERRFAPPVTCTDPAPEKAAELPKRGGRPVKSTLPARMLTSRFEPIDEAFAWIEYPGGSSPWKVSVGDSVLGALVVSIHADRVIVLNGDRFEYIEKSRPRLPPEPSEGCRQWPIGDGPDSLPPLDARIVPAFKDGVAHGMRFFSIRQGSLWEQMGLRHGDILLRVNGRDLNSPERLLELSRRLKATRLNVEFERDGVTHRLRLDRNAGDRRQRSVPRRN